MRHPIGLDRNRALAAERLFLHLRSTCVGRALSNGNGRDALANNALANSTSR